MVLILFWMRLICITIIRWSDAPSSQESQHKFETRNNADS